MEGDTQSSSIGTGTIIPSNEQLLPSGALEMGNPNAPVTLLLFTNHACAYCRAFHDDLIPRLLRDSETKDMVKVQIMAFALQKYNQSNAAATHLICAGLQGKGTAMHSLLFRSSVGSVAFTTGMNELGLDMAVMNECLQGEGVQGVIAAQQSFAQSLDVTLIPSYFINGTKYVGLPEYADLRGQVLTARK